MTHFIKINTVHDWTDQPGYPSRATMTYYDLVHDYIVRAGPRLRAEVPI